MTADLAVRRTPTLYGLAVLAMSAVTRIACRDGILIDDIRYSLLVEEQRFYAVVERIRNSGAVRPAGKHVVIHGVGGRCPYEHHAPFVLGACQALRSRKRLDRCCVVVVQRRTCHDDRLQLCGILYVQVGGRLVDAYGIRVVGTRTIGYVGERRQPRAVGLTDDTVLRNDHLDLAIGFPFRRTDENKPCGAIPHTSAQLVMYLALHLRNQHLFERIAERLYAFVNVISVAGSGFLLALERVVFVAVNHRVEVRLLEGHFA